MWTNHFYFRTHYVIKKFRIYSSPRCSIQQKPLWIDCPLGDTCWKRPKASSSSVQIPCASVERGWSDGCGVTTPCTSDGQCKSPQGMGNVKTRWKTKKLGENLGGWTLGTASINSINSQPGLDVNSRVPGLDWWWQNLLIQFCQSADIWVGLQALKPTSDET